MLVSETRVALGQQWQPHDGHPFAGIEQFVATGIFGHGQYI